MSVRDHIAEAMIALVQAQRSLGEAEAMKTVPSVSEGLKISLTDEERPVRIQHGETWMDLHFTEAAHLLMALGNIGQVREIAQELANG